MGMELETVPLYTWRHIRLYLQVRLAPGETLSEPYNQELLMNMSQRAARTLVCAVPVEHQDAPNPKLLLLRAATKGRPVDLWRIDHMQTYVRDVYKRHCNAWLDWYIDAHRCRIIDALQVWRELYGITEDDLMMDTSVKAYQRYRLKSAVSFERQPHQ